MKVRFWGTRGSIPSPGPTTVRYGGNTSCAELRLNDGQLIILDAGSGLRPLGASLGPCDATLLLTHYHWDHIQGMPFFAAAYMPKSNIVVYGPLSNGVGPEDLLDGQMSTPYFPAAPAQLVGIKDYIVTPSEPFRIGNALVRAGRVCHPQATLAYRVEEEGRAFVYMSDDEVAEASPPLLEEMLDLIRDADVLLHDCQYSEGEYPSRRGWGHSTPRMAVEFAKRGNVKRLILFHHDPSHSDEQVEALADEARALAGSDLEITIGREGDVISLDPIGTALEASEPNAG